MRIMFLLAGLILIAAGFPVYTQAASPYPNASQVSERLLKLWHLVAKDLKSDKLTKDQAVSIKTDLRSIHQQEVAFIEQNGNHELTADQQSQLNAEMDKDSQILGGPNP